MMRSSRSVLLLLALLLALAANSSIEAFTFLKGVKLPKRDRGHKIAVQKFGDKSKLMIEF